MFLICAMQKEEIVQSTKNPQFRDICLFVKLIIKPNLSQPQARVLLICQNANKSTPGDFEIQ